MTEPLTLALVRIGRIELALPTDWVDEVVAGPLALSDFPNASPHVLGAFVRRGSPVPVIDLAALLKPAGEPARPVDFVLIIRHPGGRFAIQVDAVAGVRTVAPETITELDVRSEQGSGLFSRLYTPAEGGAVAVMLDLEAVLATEGVRSAVELSATDRKAEGGGADGGNRLHVLFRAGGVGFAIEATAARRVAPYPPVLDSVITHPWLRGFYRMRGELMPVVDMASAMEFKAGEKRSDGGNLLVMGEVGKGGAVAVCVDEVLAVKSVKEKEIDAIAGDGGFVRADCVAGSFLYEGTIAVLVLKTDAFLRLVRVGDDIEFFDSEEMNAEARREHVQPVHHLVYKAGGTLLATPLAGIDAVAKVPEEYVDLRQPGRALIGMGSSNGRALPLIDLGLSLGAAPMKLDEQCRMLVTSCGQGLCGYVVQSVNFMESAVPEPLPHPDRARHGDVPPFSRMIRTRGDNREQAACVLDLADLAERRAAAT